MAKMRDSKPDKGRRAAFDAWTQAAASSFLEALPASQSKAHISEALRVLSEAIWLDATDIHVENRPQPNSIAPSPLRSTARFRTHGAMSSAMASTPGCVEGFFAIFDGAAKGNTLAKDIPFGMEFSNAGGPIDFGGFALKLRMQNMPVYPEGYDLIVRILGLPNRQAVHSAIEAQLLEVEIPGIATAGQTSSKRI